MGRACVCVTSVHDNGFDGKWEHLRLKVNAPVGELAEGPLLLELGGLLGVLFKDVGVSCMIRER